MSEQDWYRSATSTRFFSICRGKMLAGEILDHPNNGVRMYNQLVFILEGSAKANNIDLTVGAHDLSIYKNQPIRYVAGDNGVEWVAINPFSYDINYSGEIITSEQKTIVGAEQHQTLFVAKGNPVVNNKTLKVLDYAVLQTGKSFDIDTLDGSMCLIIKQISGETV